MDSRQKMQQFRPAVALPSAARDLLKTILDEGSFVEQEAFVCSTSRTLFPRESVPGDGLVGGSGLLDGRPLYVAAQDAEQFKGAVGLVHGQKFARLCEQAMDSGTAFVALLDSGGVRAEEGLAALEGQALMLRAFERAKGRIPLVAVLLGPVTGALALLAERADVLIVCEDRGGLFFYGPGVTLARAESAEKPKDLGGAAVLARRSGLAALTVPAAAELPTLLRRLFTYESRLIFAAAGGSTPAADDPNRAEAALDELAAGLDSGCDVEKIAELVFDGDSLLPCYEAYAPELFCALATLASVPVALVAQRGKLLGLAAGDKLRRFAALAESFALPLITLTQGEGFVQAEEAEREGLALAAAELSKTFSDYPYARINVYLGQAYGSHLLCFNSKWQGCARAFAWPTAEMGLLKAEQALALFGEKDLQAAASVPNGRAALLDEYAKRFAAPAEALAAGLVDEVIWPSLTRPYLYAALQALGQAD